MRWEQSLYAVLVLAFVVAALLIPPSCDLWCLIRRALNRRDRS